MTGLRQLADRGAVRDVGTPPSDRVRPRLVLGVLALTVFPFSVLQSSVSPVLVVLGRDLGVAATDASWIFTAFLLSATVTTPIVSRIGDLRGKRRTMSAVIVVQVLGTAMCGLAPTLGWMLAGRALQGTGAALFPLAYGLVRDHLPRGQVALGIGVLSSVLGAGGTVGVVTAGPISEGLGVRWVFWVPGLLMVFSTVLLSLAVPESPRRAAGGLSWLSSMLLGLGLLLLLAGISNISVAGWTAPVTLGTAAGAAVVLTVWALVESRARWPVVDVALLRRRGIWTTNLCSLLVGLALMQSFLMVPQLLLAPVDTGYGFGIDPWVMGVYMVPSSIAMVAFSPVSAWFAGRLGARAPLVIGTALCTATYTALVLGHGSLAAIVAVNFLNGVGIALAFSALPNLTVAAAPPDRTSVATGITTIARTIGGCLGTQVGASIIELSTPAGSEYPSEAGFVGVFALAAVAAGICLVVSLLVPRVAAHGSAPIDQAMAASSGPGDSTGAMPVSPRRGPADTDERFPE